ncbi:MAG: DUF4249 domain-containing protein [Bacteroidales bacterium]|nr:DUF4249 domain-containing protein [Bacteroidales bacterium]
MKKYRLLAFSILGFFILFLLSSCEKEIQVELPPYERKIVVEGWIDYDEYPIVFLTRSSDYFAQYNEAALMEMIIQDALVTVTNHHGDVDTLQFGFENNLAFPVRYKGQRIKGEYGGIYQLRIVTDDKLISATTSIPQPFDIDSVYYVEQEPNHKKGILRLKFRDQAGVNNYYRVFSKILGKHSSFIPTWGGSVTDDKFFDGREMLYDIFQGRSTNIGNPQNSGDSLRYLEFFFGNGDTVIYKYASMDYEHFNFWTTAEWEINAGGNPFISPSPVRTNIDGAIGVWGGYGSRIDTFIVVIP